VKDARVAKGEGGAGAPGAPDAGTGRPVARPAWKRRAARRGRYLVATVLLVPAALLWTPTGQAHVKAVLLLAQEVPQVPVKPLGALTNTPLHERIALGSAHNPIVADLFRPVPRFGTIQPHTEPAVMLALGVKTKASDRKLILAFAQTLSRLGYVVLWPRLRALDQGLPLLETPQTFVWGVQYLTRVASVDRHRISLFGFSVGSSLALVAAADRRIRGDVHALVFFGGYYDIFDYLTSLATQTISVDGKTVAWRPDREALGLVHELLRAEHAGAIALIFGARTRAQAAAVLHAAPAVELATLRQMSPSDHIQGLRTRIFILHDKGDHFVPYVESAKLNQALGTRVAKTYLLSDLFAHTQLKVGLSWHVIQDAAALYSYTVRFFEVMS
jgi:acetyl esterase/lipase